MEFRHVYTRGSNNERFSIFGYNFNQSKPMKFFNVLLLVFVTLAISDSRYLFNMFDLNKDNKLDYSEVLKMFVTAEEDGINTKALYQEVVRDARRYMSDVFKTEEITFAQWNTVFNFRNISSPGEPQQMHLSVTGVEGEMNIMWATKSMI
jgi:hypothetical protein